jgi:hypothetical protein
VAERLDTSAAPDSPTVADVERIGAIPNPILRNLQITHCYSRLAAGVAERTGPAANWCSFATWASRQAGSTIRGEDAGDFVQARLGRHRELTRPLTSLWRWLLRRGLLDPASRLGRLTAEIHTPFDAIERAAKSVARGNLKVFAEIGLEFARYLAAVPPDAAPDGPEMRAFLDGLRPGDPPDGQRYLRDAFLRYQRAATAQADAGTRAQLLFAANLEIGLHEQTRLQPEISEALDAPYVTHEDLGLRVLDAVLPRGTRGRKLVPDRVAAPALGWVAGRIERFSAELSREIITETFMVLSLPGRVLALRENLHDAYPQALVELADAELAELVARYEPVPPAPDDCGARDWAVIEQRMHFISHLFRAQQEQRSLFDPPFTPDQVERILAGAIPDGRL